LCPISGKKAALAEEVPEQQPAERQRGTSGHRAASGGSQGRDIDCPQRAQRKARREPRGGFGRGAGAGLTIAGITRRLGRTGLRHKASPGAGLILR
jgi:hypothetical protein